MRVYRRGVTAPPLPVWPLRNDRSERVVWVLTSALETLLALRLGLKLMGISSVIPPVHLVYQVTDPVVGLFNLGVFHLGTKGGGTQLTFQLEWDSLLAMMVFWLLGWIITIFVGLATSGQEANR